MKDDGKADFVALESLVAGIDLNDGPMSGAFDHVILDELGSWTVVLPQLSARAMLELLDESELGAIKGTMSLQDSIRLLDRTVAVPAIVAEDTKQLTAMSQVRSSQIKLVLDLKAERARHLREGTPQSVAMNEALAEAQRTLEETDAIVTQLRKRIEENDKAR